MMQVTLRYSITHQSEKSLRQLKQRHKIVGPFHDAYEKANNEQFKDIFVWLKSYMLNQFKIQHQEPFDYRVFKYCYLFSSPSIASYLEDKIGIDVKKYFQLVILFYFIYFRLGGEILVLRKPRICCAHHPNWGICGQCLIAHFNSFNNKNRSLFTSLLLLIYR